jgi:calcium-dependent protein kinase
LSLPAPPPGVIVYIMVTGTPPFNGADDRAIMRAVSKGVFEWPRNLRVSDSLKDLVGKLLTKNPDKRMTALQALEHPWIAGAATNSDESLGETLSALKDFSNASKIKKAVANILVNQMTEEDVKKLSNLFQTLDVDGDGTLDVAEIAQYMKRLFNYDDKTAKEQAGNFLKEVDVDNSGKIDVKEFQAAHVRGQLGVDTAQIKKAFDAIDTDGNGYLDTKEIEQIMQGSSNNVGSTVREIIAECDKNGDGRISCEEFIAAMKADKSKVGK